MTDMQLSLYLNYFNMDSHFLLYIYCVFVCCLISRSWIFYSYGDVTIEVEGLAAAFRPMFGTSLTKKNYSKLIYCYSSKLWYYWKKYGTIYKPKIMEFWWTKENKHNSSRWPKTKKNWFIMEKNYGNIPKQLTFLNK